MPRTSATRMRAARTHDAGVRYCGAPYASPGPAGSTAQVNPAVANATDQYLPKHFPFPWFESILKSGDCNARHIASLFDPTNGLYRDLQRESTTPAFSWITPNMCSDGHDAVCHGNNLSGGFSEPEHAASAGELHRRAVLRRPVPQACDPRDREIGRVQGRRADRHHLRRGATRRSPTPATASRTRRSSRPTRRRRSRTPRPPRRCSAVACTSSRPGRTRRLPRTLTATSCTRVPALTPTLIARATVFRRRSRACRQGPASSAEASHVPGPRTDAAATAAPGSSTIADNAAVATDPGRSVTGTGIPAGAFVGKVTDTPVNATAPNGSGGFVDIGSFTLVDSAGRLLRTTGAVSGVVLGARTPASDPLYDARDATTGGGDTGSVLISPYIRPHTTSTVFYNHYSWLRTIEDLFNVGRVSKGLDGQGSHRLRRPARTRAVRRDVFNHLQGQPVRRDQAGTGGSPAGCRSPPSQRTATLQASSAHPVLAIQGDTVKVTVRDAKVLATRRRTDRAARRPSPDPDHQSVHVHDHVHRGLQSDPAQPASVHDRRRTRSRPPPASHDNRWRRTAPAALARQDPVADSRTTSCRPATAASQWAPTRTRPIVAWDFNVEID